MNRKYLHIFLLILAVLPVSASAVPVIPNKAVVHGTVVQYCSSLQPASKNGKKMLPQYRIVIVVQSSEPVGELTNLLQGKEGEQIEFHSKSKLDQSLLGKKVKAIVEYRGDEHGGRFELRKIELEK